MEPNHANDNTIPPWVAQLTEHLTAQITQQVNEQNRLQSEAMQLRIQQLESLVQASRTPSTTEGSSSSQGNPHTIADTVNDSTNVNILTPGHTEAQTLVEALRSTKTKLPDPPLFGGNRSDWPAWRMTMINKLHKDGHTIGDQQSQLNYVYARLEKNAWRNVTTYVRESQGGRAGPHDLLNYLNRIYGDTNLAARAALRLENLRQGENTSWSKFLPLFEREFADAEAITWPENSKHRGVPATFNETIDRLNEISLDHEIYDLEPPVKQAPGAPTQAQNDHDAMEWTPTGVKINAVKPRPPITNPDGYPSTRPEDRDLLGKRAKWMPVEEINQRRVEKRCIRCGRSGCWLNRCPLKAAVNPAHQQRSYPREPRVSTTTLKDRPPRRVTFATVEETPTSDEEVLSENE
ncbi:hypothetical protein EYZ11_012226 [Aspergillus tanneri]|uniref:Retrotransposon gag domain-containing protein n=1 Tax=Aspergillus tanneri TaxID=1220188 RepID=A0A4S3J2W1_9EURO|nr:hypothetical protein EYZ11_012226 [Aspergillus tanneri]